MSIIVYTDGGCAGNPGPGGWACVIIADNEQRTASGGQPETTNNRMELTAVISALESIAADPSLRGQQVELHTDSQYVQKGMTQWIEGWIRKGWVTASKTPVKNRELWQQLKAVADELDVTWKWVKGHAGIELNELCDRLVQEEIARINTPTTDSR